VLNATSRHDVSLMGRDESVMRALGWTASSLGLIAMTYATLVGLAWHRYGHVRLPSPDEQDPLLDQFMPEYEVAERHHVRVAAPAATALSWRWTSICTNRSSRGAYSGLAHA
jgi:hypothetical protein